MGRLALSLSLSTILAHVFCGTKQVVQLGLKSCRFPELDLRAHIPLHVHVICPPNMTRTKGGIFDHVVKTVLMGSPELLHMCSDLPRILLEMAQSQ